jgi:hypothetical protein
MVGLIVAIIVFNLIAFKTNKKLTRSEIVQIWTFTIAFQQSYDILFEFKFHAYWYFGKEVDWSGFLAHLLLLSPVNMMFLNWYPYKKKVTNQILYISLFVIATLIYELITLLPSPWGYFHLGWWKIWYDAFWVPLLLCILLWFYKWVRWLENKDRLEAQN